MLADDRRVRLPDKIAHSCRVPVIASRHGSGVVHALLHDRPFAAVAENETMKIKLEAIGDGVVVHPCREPTGAHQAAPVEASLVSDGAQLVGSLARMLSASPADVYSQLVGTGTDTSL